MKQSLLNMKMDYVDLVYLHRYDQDTDLEETVLAMKDVLSRGQALYWGTSEWHPVRLMQAMYICDKYQCPRPIAEQCLYNMFVRDTLEDKYRIHSEEMG